MNEDVLPCEVNAGVTCENCEKNNDGCPLVTLYGAAGAYEIVKSLNPIKTSVKPGVNLQELIKAQFPAFHKYFNKYFDWNDLDGILDFLYFHAKVLHINEAQQLINLIESNCEVHRG